MARCGRGWATFGEADAGALRRVIVKWVITARKGRGENEGEGTGKDRNEGGKNEWTEEGEGAGKVCKEGGKNESAAEGEGSLLPQQVLDLGPEEAKAGRDNPREAVRPRFTHDNVARQDGGRSADSPVAPKPP